MKKFFLSTSLLATLSLSLIADTVMSTSEVDSDYQNFPGRAGSNDVFAGAPYPKNSCNLELFGEFLWMDSGFDTVTTMSGNAWQTNPQDFHRNFDGFATHYQPAFRLGLGYQFEQQGWDLVGSYLYFKNNKSRSTDRPYYGFEEKEDWGGWLAPVVVWWPSDIQTSKYNLSYNQGDLSFAKEIFFTKYYSLKPSMGPRYVSAQYGFKNLAANVSNTDQPPLSNASVEMSNNVNYSRLKAKACS